MGGEKSKLPKMNIHIVYKTMLTWNLMDPGQFRKSLCAALFEFGP